MQFNVAQLLKSPPGTVREYQVDERVPVLDEGLVTTEPVTGTVRLNRTNRGILAEARLATAVQLECSRCVEPFILPVRLHFREEYIPSVDISTGLPVPATADESAFRIDENHIVDLGEAVRQYALIEMPLQPLCSLTCRGLCPECGQNLNLAACNCAPRIVDTRLEKLGALLAQLEGAGDEASAEQSAEQPRQRMRRRR